MQRFAFEKHGDEDGEDGERDDLLNHLQLHQREGPAVADKADAVGRHLTGIFRQGQKPRQQDDEDERRVLREDVDLLQLQVTVPGEGHEDVGDNEQSNSINLVHIG